MQRSGAISFRGTNAQPLQVTFRGADRRIISADRIQGEFGDDSSATFDFMDTRTVQTGWAFLEYDGESQITGMLAFRQRVSGRPDLESSVSLSRDAEARVYMPFDNALG